MDNPEPAARFPEMTDHRRSFRSLAWRILGWMSVVSLAPLLIVAYQGYHCAREALVQSHRVHLESVVDSRKARIRAWLAELKADTAHLAVAPCAIGACRTTGTGSARSIAPPCCGFLANAQRSRPEYLLISTFDSMWNQVSSTAERKRPPPPALTAQFKHRLEESPNLQVSMHEATTGDTPRVLVGHPIQRGDGARIGFLVITLDAARSFAPILNDRAGLGESGMASFKSDRGMLLVGADTMTARAKILSANKDAAASHAASQSPHLVRWGARVPEVDGEVIVEVDEAEAFAWLHRLQFRTLATCIAAFAIILLLSTRIARRLAGPMHELADVARKIARGGHRERLRPFREPEAEEVATAFNTMLDQLDASYRRLSHAAALASVGRLTSSIVHEMRNPLSSVKLNLQALRTAAALTPAQTELTEIAADQASRLERMLTDLLKYGRPLNVEQGPTLFRDLCRDAISDVQSLVDEKQVTIRVTDDLDATPLMVDAELIRRALTNLLANAVQALASGGEVTVAARTSTSARGMADVSVADNGPGIPRSSADRLFQPFFTTREGGTGLGLANVRKIVEYHGGTASAENSDRGGAVFSISLPLGGETQ